MQRIKNFVSWTLILIGSVTFVLLALAFTALPFRAYHALSGEGCSGAKPNLIVVLGGSGMPSGDGFVRAHYAALAAKEHPESLVLLMLAATDSSETGLAQTALFTQTLCTWGVEAERITMITYGSNTHEQAEAVAAFGVAIGPETGILVVTSPHHILRSVLAIKRSGAHRVCSMAAWEIPLEEGALLRKVEKGVPDPGLMARYNVWTQLHYEITVLREWVALAYYQLMGWI